MERSIHCQSVLVCLLLKKKGGLNILLAQNQFFCHTQVICVCTKLQITGCHKISLCKISFGKHVTQSWILGVRLKNTNETK